MLLLSTFDDFQFRNGNDHFFIRTKKELSNYNLKYNQCVCVTTATSEHTHKHKHNNFANKKNNNNKNRRKQEEN